MHYEYLEDIATADVAFEATADTVESVFVAACDATLNVMVDDIDAVDRTVVREIFLQDDDLEILLFRFLNDVLYIKDAERLFLRVCDLGIATGDGVYHLAAQMCGERIDARRHALLLDVKAATLHRLAVESTESGWRARVVLDV